MKAAPSAPVVSTSLVYSFNQDHDMGYMRDCVYGEKAFRKVIKVLASMSRIDVLGVRPGGRAWATRGAAWLGAPERPPGLCGLPGAWRGGGSLSERRCLHAGMGVHGEDGMLGRPHGRP